MIITDLKMLRPLHHKLILQTIFADTQELLNIKIHTKKKHCKQVDKISEANCIPTRKC